MFSSRFPAFFFLSSFRQHGGEGKKGELCSSPPRRSEQTVCLQLSLLMEVGNDTSKTLGGGGKRGETRKGTGYRQGVAFIFSVQPLSFEPRIRNTYYSILQNKQARLCPKISQGLFLLLVFVVFSFFPFFFSFFVSPTFVKKF